jgi:hypothetical protein
MSSPPTGKDARAVDLEEKASSSSTGAPQHTKVVDAANADYALALSSGPQLSPTSWRSLQLYAILLVAFMGSLSNGFDGQGA